MAKFDLEPGEQELGHWTIHYLPPTGGKYAGKLLVTDRRVLYEPLKAGPFPRQDLSAKGLVGSLTVRTVVGQNHWDGASLSIPRAEVQAVEKRRTRGMKQVVVTLADGQEFVFDNGLMSVDKLAALLGG
jgi:hypothetical protein